jgi:hypothetical protein
VTHVHYYCTPSRAGPLMAREITARVNWAAGELSSSGFNGVYCTSPRLLGMKEMIFIELKFQHHTLLCSLYDWATYLRSSC